MDEIEEQIIDNELERYKQKFLEDVEKLKAEKARKQKD